MPKRTKPSRDMDAALQVERARPIVFQDRAELLHMVGMVIGVIVLPLAGGIGHALAYGLLALWALRSPRHALEALTLTWLLNFLNPGIYSPSGQSDMLRWAVVGSAFLSVIRVGMLSDQRFGGRPLTTPAWYAVALFCSVAAILALFASYIPDVSMSMLAMFLIGTTTVLFGYALTASAVDYWERWFLVFFGVILLVGFPLIVHDLGYARNNRGFQGLTNHPQTYGVFLAPFLSWIVALLLSRRLTGTLWWGIVGVACISLIATQARTGAFAVALGLTLMIGFKYFQRPAVRAMLSAWLPRLILAGLLGMAGLVAYGVDVRTHVVEFVQKQELDPERGRIDMDEVTRTRRMLTDQSLANFEESPLVGIGFGVRSSPSYALVRARMENAGLGERAEDLFPEAYDYPRDPIFGIPMAGGSEKGTTVVAVLEEVGVIGFAFFLLMLGALLLPTLRASVGIAPGALMLTGFLLTFGEAVFFAFGGMGLLLWLLFGLGYTQARERAPHATATQRAHRERREPVNGNETA